MPHRGRARATGTRFRFLTDLLAVALLAVLAGCAAVDRQPAEFERGAEADGAMVAVAHPLAAEAGREMLEAGGSAADAAIAAQLVLNLVEPQSSGIGGGGFALHYHGDDGGITAYDGRETAPAEIGPELFLDDDGGPVGYREAVVGGRSVGVPGLLRMLEVLHADHGVLPWEDLFQPAIHLARDGFTVTPRLHGMIAGDPWLADQPATRAYFFTADGAPLPVGHRLRNPEFAEVLQQVAEGGVDRFYHGAIAESIISTVRHAEGNPGLLHPDDLAAYRAVRRAPVCRPYRGHTVCGMPPPTSGGVAVLQILGILEHFDSDVLDPRTVDGAHLLAEVSRLAFADRERFLADPDFSPVPVAALLDPDYLAGRAGCVDPERSMGEAWPGLPAWLIGAPDHREVAATSHLSVVDFDGNAVSMTTSIEQAFGSRLMVHGFLLNNQLTDFSFRPEDEEGRPVANRPEPGKRPRSSMAPMLILDEEGAFRAVVGSPGGPRIIGFVAQRVVALLDAGLSINEAVAMPNVVNRNGPTELEEGRSVESIADALRRRGHTVEIVPLTSGLHGIEAVPGSGALRGAADPRREGAALGLPPRGL